MDAFSSDAALDAAMLHRAALHAVRASGDVEPNPLVGCIVGRVEQTRDGFRPIVLGMGHHQRLGGAHAEAAALDACRQAGAATRAATLWVTLEPCAHHGRTPPCVDAIVCAGIGRVVAAAPDPGEGKGGFAALRQAGVTCDFCDAADFAVAISAPHRKCVQTNLPWVIAKWAQTLDGKIADRTGASAWISAPTSRQRVHRLRSRMDAIIIGAATAIADDPLLTARNVRRVRRVARRVVVDGSLRTPTDSALARSIAEGPITIACAKDAEDSVAAQAWRAIGAEVVALDAASLDGLSLKHLFVHLRQTHGASSVLVEGGARLLGSCVAASLVDEAIAYVAPIALGDAQAVPITASTVGVALADASRFALVRTRRSGVDVELWWRRANA